MTLAILSSMLVLLMATSRSTRQTPRSEAAFWQTFQANWRHVQSDIATHDHKTVIRFDPQKGVIFDGVRWRQVLVPPETLKIKAYEEIVPQEGGTFSPQRVTLYSTETGQHYQMVIQMGWGVYQIETK